MSFPITHLRVAYAVAKKMHLSETQTAQFLLGALAPDGVHYRPALYGAEMHIIGAAKKISHLCPVSDEPWGFVTDNEGWVQEIKAFLLEHPNDVLAAGYAVHALTDLHNNRTIWTRFRLKHPEMAKVGYGSDYYNETAALDLALYQEAETVPMMALLRTAAARDFIGRVSAEDIHAIRDSLYLEKSDAYTAYVNQPPAQVGDFRFVTMHDMRQFLTEATEFAFAHMPVL
ncbi:MAG: hypothetical protein FWC16_06445 [Defluviitaleaceae bacterium]|nr:hypothetical protein [Defluviitaleaceae bacterium]MCL2274549.1 hypothetical protein [Defluviitaleaceae bacterium]